MSRNRRARGRAARRGLTARGHPAVLPDPLVIRGCRRHCRTQTRRAAVPVSSRESPPHRRCAPVIKPLRSGRRLGQSAAWRRLVRAVSAPRPLPLPAAGLPGQEAMRTVSRRGQPSGRPRSELRGATSPGQVVCLVLLVFQRCRENADEAGLHDRQRAYCHHRHRRIDALCRHSLDNSINLHKILLQ